MPLTVTVHNIGTPKRSLADLQLFLVFCHLTSQGGRTKSQAAYIRMIDYLDNYVGGAGRHPFDIIKKIIADGKLDEFVTKGVQCGKASCHKKFFKSVARIDFNLRVIDRCSLAKEVKGLSITKASMFTMFRDKDWDGAILNKDVRTWLRDEFNKAGQTDKAEMIPTGPISEKRQYERVEKYFIQRAKASEMSPRDLFMKIVAATKETKFDKADYLRIEEGGTASLSHWATRPSRKDISLEI